jgi:hypothetical protein
MWSAVKEVPMRTGVVLKILPRMATYAATIRASDESIMSAFGDLA